MVTPFTTTQMESLIRTTAYHRRDFDLAVVWIPPQAHDRVMPSISSTFRDPLTSLGQLDRLPLELINKICLQLDIASLFRFRQTNCRARQVIDSLHEYHVVSTHSLGCYCALLRTKSASRVTLSGFYRLLCEQVCSLCGDRYGDLANLLIWARCCSFCLRRRAPALRVAAITKARRILRFSREEIRRVPSLKTLAGIYSMNEKLHKTSIEVVMSRSALSACQKEFFKGRPTLEAVSQSGLEFMVCCALPSYDPETGHLQHGVSCVGCQIAMENADNPREINQLSDMRDAVYSEQRFLEHFKGCEYAQQLWASSEHGAIEPTDYPVGCKNGGYFKPR